MSEPEKNPVYARPSAYQAARNRADGQCEVLVQARAVWVRCPGFADDVHHMLPRARGGKLLDQCREDYHLVVCCRAHHREIHEHPTNAYLALLTIDGYALRVHGKVVYVGTDEYLTDKYGGNRVTEEAARGRPAHHPTPRPLAGPARRRPAS